MLPLYLSFGSPWSKYPRFTALSRNVLRHAFILFGIIATRICYLCYSEISLLTITSPNVWIRDSYLDVNFNLLVISLTSWGSTSTAHNSSQMHHDSLWKIRLDTCPFWTRRLVQRRRLGFSET
jgi:hypothetical protein